jgi:hypothetical protein
MAYQVRLLFPVDVTVQPTDKANTEYNTLAREPVLEVARATSIVIKAQVEWAERKRGAQDRSGREDKSQGYFVVLTKDLTTKGWTPKYGDKITNIPDHPGVYYVISATPHAHRGGKSRTMHVEFRDRMPTKAG